MKLAIRTKLILASVLLLTIPLLVLGILSYQKAKNTLDDYGNTRLQNSVEMTISMIAALNKEVEKGNISLEDAQEEVKIAILGEKDAEGNRPINKNIDVGENGYIYILDENGTQLAHPSIEGENVWEEQDENGVYFGQEQIRIAMDGGGTQYYDWPFPGTDRIEQKVAYVKADPHWNWVIAASTYVVDFNKPANAILNQILIVTSITLLIGVAAIWLFANSISRPITKVTEHMNLLAAGDLTQEVIDIKSKDETGYLANGMNEMQDGLRELIGDVSNASEVVSRDRKSVV